MEFNEDGSLKTNISSNNAVELFQEESPHQSVLKLINELDFPVGKKMLSSILRGEADSRIKKFRFNFCENFGSLDGYDPVDIYELLDTMISNNYIEIQKTSSTKYFPVVALTNQGFQELVNPTSNNKLVEYTPRKELFQPTNITDDDYKIFSALSSFLDGFNDEQKKGVIENNNKILCVAGAGSGKTTVLTKRIEFLTKIRGINSKSILAITFTRKARQEMLSRLSNIDVDIETFNSFCEKILKKHENIFYSKNYRVLGFRDKIKLFREALETLGYNLEQAIDKYYSSRKGKDSKTLFFGLMNDTFSLMDHYKNNLRDISLFKDAISKKCMPKDKSMALFVYNLIIKINELKSFYGFRDYTDQIVHCKELFESRDDLIPKYEHILVDEYQDVNDIQVGLLELLNPENLFVVGDPRQSIYGWRGSKIKNILNFTERFPNCSVIQLTKNYRSSKKIIDIANKVISPTGFPDIEFGSSVNEKEIEASSNNDCNNIALVKHSDEKSEHIFVAHSILSQDVPREEIFVLTRTNKQIDSISEVFVNSGIKFIARKGDDNFSENSSSEAVKEGHVTISTVHAIKGMEADVVYIIGANTKMFPCLVSEHPVQDLAKIDFDYDKQEEELRLLYVAVTRARKKLLITYSGRLTKFLPEKVQKIIETSNSLKSNISKNSNPSNSDIFESLRQWRIETSRKKNLPPFMIFHDKVFHQIERELPRTKEELVDIIGFKKQDYANDILEILNS